MTSSRLDTVVQHKAQLIARAAVQREVIADIARGWQTRMSAVDRGMSVLGILKAHPVIAGLGVAILLTLRRATLMRWTGRILMLWRGWRMVQSLLRGQAVR